MSQFGDPMHLPRRPGRRRPGRRIYASLLSVGIVIVLALLAGLFVVPAIRDGLAERQHIETLLESAVAATSVPSDGSLFRDEKVARAVKWWSAKIAVDPARRARFLELWQSARGCERTFVVLGQVVVDAGLMGEQSADLRLRWFRLFWLNHPNPQQRASFINSLLTFPPAEDELRQTLAQAGQDKSEQVVGELAYMLPAWTDRPWAVEMLGELLGDQRPLVRRRAVLAVALIADSLSDSAAGRAAIIAFRNRLVALAGQDTDEHVRANACWGLFRLGWMARSGFELLEPDGPAVMRRMAVMFLTNPPIETDHTEPVVMQHALEYMAAKDPDVLTRQRAGIALAMLPLRSGMTRPVDPALVDAMLRNRDWMTVAVGARLAALSEPLAGDAGDHAPDDDDGDASARPATPLTLLLARVAQSPRPDLVSEQIAFSLGMMATRAFGRGNSPEFINQKAQAIRGLALLANPAIAATQPDLVAAATPRTRLAVAVAAAQIDDPELLFNLAGEMLPQENPYNVPPDTLADMACLEIARLTGDRMPIPRDLAVQRANAWMKDYSDRLVRSGVLLLALLDERSQNNWLLDRYRRLLRSGHDDQTAVYQQLALLALGVEEVERPAPAGAANHLLDPNRRTPGTFAMLLLAGRRQALDELLSGSAPASARVLIDHWRMRDHLARWVRPSAAGGIRGYELALPGAGLYPIPAADPQLSGFVADMHNWWYDTHRHRLQFFASERLWRLR